MKIYSEGFRRVTTEGEFEANQNSKLRFGVLISVACIGSLSLISKADGKDFTPTIVDEINGDLNLFSKIEVSHVIEHRTIDLTIDINSDANCEVEFSRQATSQISLTFDGGSANWESPVVWENMDVYWDAPEASNTPYLAKVYNRNASSSISLSASVGTADYGSSVFWEFMDVNWDDEDTSTGNQFFSTVHNRNASAGISISTTVGQAGWASDFVWEGLDVNWDDEVSGQFIQGNVNTSFNLFGTSSFVLADLENRTASANIEVSSSVTFNVIRQRTATSSSSFSMTVGSAGWASDLIWEQADVEWHLTSGQLIQEGASSSLSLSTNVSGEIDTIYLINASSQFSLSTNINSEKIAGWNSDTTLIENSTRNWETS